MKTKTKTSVRFDDVAAVLDYTGQKPINIYWNRPKVPFFLNLIHISTAQAAIGNFDPLMREDWNRGLTYLMILKFLRNLNRDFHA
ncbi:hypothetical protein LWI29_033798 [Acer saccharum]|uniref:Uncharacterized protein n=1 Tax=Acer saccharum TaxID=4024 RepID=A0AA39SQW0_ACESA|nr:hypothetical protein LWI29_033798 [Acer saccharum]